MIDVNTVATGLVTCGCAGCLLSVYQPVLLLFISIMVLVFLVFILGIEVAFIWRRCNERNKRIAKRREAINGRRDRGDNVG
jgi:Flp pilus assembly protein TadB